MPHCAVIWCCNQSKNVNKHNSGVTYHKFPSDPQIKNKWILATGKCDWSPGKHDTICSAHFEDESFLKRNPSTQLCSDAFPTLKLHPFFTENYSSRHNDGVDSVKSEDIAPIKCEKISAEETVVEPVMEFFQDNASSQQTAPSSPQTEPKTKCPKVKSNIQDTSQMRKMKLNLMRAQDTIKKQRFQLRRYREANKNLSNKVAEMEALVKKLQEKSVANEKDINKKDECLNIKFKRKRF